MVEGFWIYYCRVALLNPDILPDEGSGIFFVVEDSGDGLHREFSPGLTSVSHCINLHCDGLHFLPLDIFIEDKFDHRLIFLVDDYFSILI
nr:hypothetical protein [Veillonella sp.]